MSGDAQARPGESMAPVAWRDMWWLVGANLAVRLALVPLNAGEYTDGILQLTQRTSKNGLYPPAFGMLAGAVDYFSWYWFPLGLELSGRVCSAMMGGVAVAYIWNFAHRLEGRRAAAWASILFSLSPLGLRWGAHAMTDMTFTAYSTLALFGLWAAMEPEPALGSPWRPSWTWPRNHISKSNSRAGDYRLDMLGTGLGCGAIATATRYQGALLLPMALVVGVVVICRVRRLNSRVFYDTMLWVLLPIWLSYGGFAHGKQFTDRTGVGTLTQQAMAWLNTAESFVLVAPYYFGYPLAVWALVALVARVWTGPGSAGGASWARFAVLQAVWGGGLLAAHSAFGSFQYRTACFL